jgi:hypothetical protein
VNGTAIATSTSSFVATSARILVFVLVLTLAAISGLIVGNAIQGRLGTEATTSAQVGGMVPGNAGGTHTTPRPLGQYVPANRGGTRSEATAPSAPAEPEVWTVPGLR